MGARPPVDPSTTRSPYVHDHRGPSHAAHRETGGRWPRSTPRCDAPMAMPTPGGIRSSPTRIALQVPIGEPEPRSDRRCRISDNEPILVDLDLETLHHEMITDRS